jgi:hypothetical protein
LDASQPGFVGRRDWDRMVVVVVVVVVEIVEALERGPGGHIASSGVVERRKGRIQREWRRGPSRASSSGGEAGRKRTYSVVRALREEVDRGACRNRLAEHDGVGVRGSAVRSGAEVRGAL